MGRTMVSMPAPISLDDAVRRLYDGPAADFVRVRKELAARAKSEGAADVARAITALRKPTVAAETVNHLEDQPLGELLAVGTALRAAQTRLDTDEMKRLTSERHRLLDAVLATVSVSPAVRDEVRCTLLAATADPSAEAAVASRTLVRGLRYSGWGEVDLSDALAHRDAAARGRAALRIVNTDSADREAEREAAARDAERRTATQEVERARRRLSAAVDAYDAAKAARDSAQAALAAAETRVRALDER